MNQKAVSILDCVNQNTEYYPCFYILVDPYELQVALTIKSGEKLEPYDFSSVKERINEEFNFKKKITGWIDWDFIRYDSRKINFRNYDTEDGVLRLFDNGSLILTDDKAKQIAESALSYFNGLIGSGKILVYPQ